MNMHFTLLTETNIKSFSSQGLVDRTYLGGRDQKDHGSKPAWANSLRDPTWKNPSQKMAGRMPQGVGPKFKPW
jgi:hypothetical protein